MARPSNQQRKMAELYVNGPDHVKHRWDVCAQAAGLDPAPSRDDPTMRTLIDKLGGAVLPDAPDIVDPLEKVFAMSEAGVPWVQMRGAVQQVMAEIATGKRKSTASQVAMINTILKKAEEMEASEAESRHHVILLPVQGEGPTLQFDPEYRARIKSLEADADVA